MVDHLPPILVETAGDRLIKDTPRPYLRWIMAKSLATRMVYREGYAALEAMPEDVIASLALDFLRIEQDRLELAKLVEQSSMDRAGAIGDILRKAGILSTMDRASTNIDL